MLAAYACHVEMLTLRPPGKLQDQHNYAVAEFLLNIHYEKHCINTAAVLREHKGAAPQCAELCRHPSTFTASWPLCPVLHRPHNIPSAHFHSCKIDFTLQLRIWKCFGSWLFPPYLFKPQQCSFNIAVVFGKGQNKIHRKNSNKSISFTHRKHKPKIFLAKIPFTPINNVHCK